VKHLGLGSLDFALRRVRGGKRAVMEELAPLAMQFEPRLKPAIQKWQQLTPWRRRFVTLDDLAAEADLTEGEFLAAVVRVGFEFTHSITDLLVACAFPDVVVASIKRAKTLNGFEDRQLLFEHMSSFAAREQAANIAHRATATHDGGAMEQDYPAFLRTDRVDSERTPNR
jgi:hypothetical protein